MSTHLFALTRNLSLVAMASLLMTTSPAVAYQSCGADWPCWDMYPYAEVPVWTNDDPGTPGFYDPDVPSPVMIYLHSNGPYGGTGVSEEEYWLKLWPAGYDGHEYYAGLRNWPVEFLPPDGSPPRETGWIYVLPNGAVDTPANATCADVGSWAYWRYWNATPNCCAYNWYVEGSYTEVSWEAPDHTTYLNNLIAWLKLNYNVDENRVYIYGYSNGGYMCHRMACENGNTGYYGYPDYDVDPGGGVIPPQAIAAVGTYAGVTFMDPENCNGVWPTNVLHTHDMGDQACLYAGGLDLDFAGECYPGLPRPYPGAIATVSSWIFMNQTNGDGVILPPVEPFDLAVPYSTAQVIDWPGGRFGSRVQHWRGIFGSHGATFSNAYRNRLVDWFLHNPRPDYPMEAPCPADIDGSGVIDVNDVLTIIAGWDDPYGVDQLLAVLKAWGECA
ncbi:MAG: hypothetical protein MK116_11330 [Phycisphaerales bacterium]|nr:hypothetical protein [Phycisphaerales bacterium]